MFARLRDETGIPVDLLYIGAGGKGTLPHVVAKTGETRPVTSEEFEQGVKDCIAILQRRSPRSMNLDASEVNKVREWLEI